MDELFFAIQEAANTIATPNWTDIMNVCFSLLAIIVAGLVAWRQNEILRKQTSIADRQNQIALFEKRIEAYEVLLACCASIEVLKPTDKKEDIIKRMIILLGKNLSPYREADQNEAIFYLINCSLKLRRATFFFSEKIAPFITNVSFGLFDLANTDVKKVGLEEYNKKIQNYFEAIKSLNNNKILINIAKEMKMI